MVDGLPRVELFHHERVSDRTADGTSYRLTIVAHEPYPFRLGAVGHPEVPDHVTLHGLLLPIRKGFDQFVCKRPNVLFDGIESPLRGYDAGDIDFVVYRENTEGEYADIGGREHRGFDHETAVQSALFTRHGTERIVRAAFEAATERDGHLTSVTKSNAQAHSMCSGTTSSTRSPRSTRRSTSSGCSWTRRPWT